MITYSAFSRFSTGVFLLKWRVFFWPLRKLLIYYEDSYLSYYGSMILLRLWGLLHWNERLLSTLFLLCYGITSRQLFSRHLVFCISWLSPFSFRANRLTDYFCCNIFLSILTLTKMKFAKALLAILSFILSLDSKTYCRIFMSFYQSCVYQRSYLLVSNISQIMT